MREASKMNSKTIAFVALMAALGNVLSGLSMFLVSFLPTVSLGGYSISVALDLSHITTFIAALYGGPLIGCATGFAGGLVAANEFGFSQGNLVTGFGLPIGKALTGITAGFIMRALRAQEKRRRVIMVISTLISYVPEAIFTIALFLVIFPFVFGTPVAILISIVIPILIKGLIEMVAEGLVLVTLSGNQSFAGLLKSFFTPSTKMPEPATSQKPQT